MNYRSFLVSTILPLALVGCAAEESTGPSPFDDREFALSDHDPLFEGAPSNDELPFELKADVQLPASYSELVALQSPVKSQGSRGVCSIFSTAALMEHLYILEGTLADPDFSEQYLQWSAKFEVRSFPNTSGSNAYYNLRAISDYGIVTEDMWPYETQQWNTFDDPACDGSDAQPTRCYTNGAPPAEAVAATKYSLPRGRWVNSRRDSIKSHMIEDGSAVVVGFTFFYQSWNHRLSDLPVNAGNWAQGLVLYPNAEDREKSLAKRAGHSILLVGWDDDLEFPRRDAEGDVITDDAGEPVMEKGFFIFKNSWGTGSFGANNPYGDGYGFISMDYIEDYGRAYVSDLPTVPVPAEVCDDGIDNDGDAATDCADSDCAGDAACAPTGEVLRFTSDESLDIPDNDPVGTASTIAVADGGIIAALAVEVDIAHTYRGDLQVVLEQGGTQVVLHNRTGGAADNLVARYEVSEWNGAAMAGEWKLTVTDRAAIDTGRLNGWALEITAAE